MQDSSTTGNQTPLAHLLTETLQHPDLPDSLHLAITTELEMIFNCPPEDFEQQDVVLEPITDWVPVEPSWMVQALGGVQ